MTERGKDDERCGHFQDLSTRSPTTSTCSARSLPVLACGYVEVRSAWGTNILDLDSGQLDTVRETLDGYGLKVSSIGSPIGKIAIDDEFPPHLERMRHAVEVAKTLEAPYIRIFSFFIPEGTDPDSRRDEVLSRMSCPG